jgi:UDP-3-O-[3-hydroxymyristoyl] glucosamine N-acyltransferase
MTRLDLTLSAVLELLGEGKLIGDPEFVCRSLAMLEKAGPEELSFVRDRRHLASAQGSHAGALLVFEALDGVAGHQIVVERPELAFARLLGVVARRQREQPPGIHPTAVVHGDAELGADVRIGPGAVVRSGARIGDRSVLYANVYVGERCRLGADCVLYPNVVLMEDVEAGDRVVVQPGAVIGCEGYGYIQQGARQHKVPQIGRIVLGDDVEIGALATIDRAMIDRTEIGRGTKVGDLVHVAHNCRIGEDVLLLPTVAVSGSVTIGDRAVLAGRAGTAGHLTVGEDAVLAGTAVAFKDVPPGAQMWGNPAKEKGLEMRIQALLRRLPELFREVRELRAKLDD